MTPSVQCKRTATAARIVWRSAAVALVSAVMFLGVRVARLCGFPVEDEVVVAFCGTQKGMAAGVPMASLIFPPEAVGLLLLPLLIYHPLQLIICAVVAGRYARRPAPRRGADFPALFLKLAETTTAAPVRIIGNRIGCGNALT